ncbi:hypothetical protein CAPTEDRAFT_174194 [Capitella teleta]|uniref:CTCK domain-containing protein n=1 Tax=Capitella teleta TaxID=283909 RepID=R7T7J8_CAPTE|nr:hypothetical protein CAPTEDRAFT_109977 [Capitella teleta]ELT93239.1 hypothetical protein CAPTEDRAFT_174194 [Capitella teleta]|eukprot:ELT87390.1 hypothetical protein CAPTEDRAFT_109977 [Capitella teleta]
MASSIDTDLLVLLFGLVLLLSTSKADTSQEECNTLHSTVTFSSPKTIELEDGRRRRIFCTGEVTVKKCEGFCTSRVSPSVVQYPGFKKNCTCCKETRLRNRVVLLTNCFEGDQALPDESASLFIREPDDCACSSCEI